jgi:hypothetical protein
VPPCRGIPTHSHQPIHADANPWAFGLNPLAILCWIFGRGDYRFWLHAMPVTESNPTAAGSPKSSPAKENLLLNLACNVILPGLVLSKLSRPERLGPLWALVAALALPLGYGVWDWMKRRHWNLFSTLGITGTLATGGMSLGSHFGWWQATALWFAIKEAAIPLIIGLSIPLTLRSETPLVKTLLYNDQLMDTAKVAEVLRERRAEGAFERLLRESSWLLSLSFLISSALNFFLALWLLKAVPNSPEWNEQLGRMNWLSWPVIVIPSTGMMMWALFRLMNGIQRLTGLPQEQLFRGQPPKPN